MFYIKFVLKINLIMLDYKKNCICNDLRKGIRKSIDIEDYKENYIGLTMEFGSITAHGEENCYASIRFCPFCGREFKR